MKHRETTAQWDDLLPGAKVVGKRCPPKGGLEIGDVLQQLARDMAEGRVRWPKGVWRFKTHEEADAWWIDQMKIYKQPDHQPE